MLVLVLDLTVNGPCGFGGKHVPMSGIKQSPPIVEDRMRVARISPKLDGSNKISNETSRPLGFWLGAAVIVLSTLKSALSTYFI